MWYTLWHGYEAVCTGIVTGYLICMVLFAIGAYLYLAFRGE